MNISKGQMGYVRSDESKKKQSRTKSKSYTLISPDGNIYNYTGIPLRDIATELDLSYNLLNEAQRCDMVKPIIPNIRKNSLDSLRNTKGWIIVNTKGEYNNGV